MATRRLLFALVAGAILATLAGVWASSSQSATAPDRQSALTASRFSITIDGFEIASFSELGGITTGNLPSAQQQNPPTVVLKRGMTRNLELNAWHELVILGDVAAARKNAVLTIYDAESKPVARYHLENAWPAKIEIGALKAGASEVLMETVTIVCEHLQRVSV
jgi:hypothetical protein